MFPDLYLPANIGTATIPKFFDPDRYDPRGIPIVVQIENLESTRQEFELYAVYEEFPNAMFVRIMQE